MQRVSHSHSHNHNHAGGYGTTFTPATPATPPMPILPSGGGSDGNVDERDACCAINLWPWSGGESAGVLAGSLAAPISRMCGPGHGRGHGHGGVDERPQPRAAHEHGHRLPALSSPASGWGACALADAPRYTARAFVPHQGTAAAVDPRRRSSAHSLLHSAAAHELHANLRGNAALKFIWKGVHERPAPPGLELLDADTVCMLDAGITSTGTGTSTMHTGSSSSGVGHAQERLPTQHCVPAVCQQGGALALVLPGAADGLAAHAASPHRKAANKARTRTASLSHRCSFCPKVFVTPSKRKRHELIHTGMRPFSCELCERRFTQRCGLKSHSQLHARARALAFAAGREKPSGAAGVGATGLINGFALGELLEKSEDT